MVETIEHDNPVAEQLRPLVEGILGPKLPMAIRMWDGSSVGPVDAAATIVVRSPNALRRLVYSPNELGLGRAYVAGELDVEGDVFAALAVLRGQIADEQAKADVKL